MSVTAVDLSVVTIESLVAQDISDYSLRRAVRASAAAPPRDPALVEPVPGAPAHPHRTAAGRRLAQVH